MENKVKYVDLQGLANFAIELKKWIQTQEIKVSSELLDEKFAQLESKLKDLDIPIVKGEAENSVVLKGGNNIASSSNSSAFGLETKASGDASHAEGYSTHAAGGTSHAEGYDTGAGGASSHAEGMGTEATGLASHAEGYYTDAKADYAHSEGQETRALSFAAHAEGYNTEAKKYAHAEGNGTVANGESSHAEGLSSEANGIVSHAEGRKTFANGEYSHSEGRETEANGKYSHAEGFTTITYNEAEHASGRYNNSVEKTESNTNADATLFSIGIGDSKKQRKNAFEVKQNGDIYIEGVGGYDGTTLDDATDVATVISSLENNTPIVKGEGENSAILKNENNIAGLRGYRFSDYYVGDDGTIVLYALYPDEEVTGLTKLDKFEYLTNDFNISYPKGANISVVTDGHHNRVIGTVKDTYYNMLTVETSLSDLMFGPDEKGSEYAEMQYSFFSLEYPEIGNAILTRGTISLGKNNKSLGSGTVALGTNNKAIISNAVALGVNTTSMGWGATSEGIDTVAYGMGSHAEGVSTYNIFDDINNLNLKEGDIETLWLDRGKDFSATYGYGSHNEGHDNLTTGYASHAEGMNNHAKGYHAHVEGKGNTAHKYAHAEGQLNVAEGATSHAEGYKTKSIGKRSHTEGYYTVANNDNEHASGQYNKSDENTIFSVGIGTSENDRKNAIKITKDGEVYISNGKLYTDSISSSYGISSETNLRAPKGYLEEVKTSRLYNDSGVNIAIDGDLIVNSKMTSKKTSEFLDNVYIGKEDGTDNADLIVTGAISAKYKITTQSALEIGTTLKTGGNATIGGALTTKNKITSGSGLEVPGRTDLKGNTYIGDSINDTFGIKAKTYLYGVGGYDGTNPTDTNDLATIINNLATKQDIENAITITLNTGV